MGRGETVTVKVAIEGMDALDDLSEKVAHIAQNLERLCEIANKVFSLCDYCGEHYIVGVQCPGCGRMNTIEEYANP